MTEGKNEAQIWIISFFWVIWLERSTLSSRSNVHLGWTQLLCFLYWCCWQMFFVDSNPYKQSSWWYLTSDGCVPCYFYESCIVLACWTWHFVTCGIRYGCQPFRTRFKIFIPGCWNKLQVLCNTFIPLHCYYLLHCCSSNNENLGKNNLVLNLSWLPAIMTEFVFWFSIVPSDKCGHST